MPVNTLHPEYESAIGAWERARDVLAGEERLKVRGKLYLPRLDSQSDQEFSAYVARASFFNATARTLDGYLGLLFRREPSVSLPAARVALATDIELRGAAQEDGNAWGVNDLAQDMSGADPLGAIASRLAAYWARTDQGILLNSLKGLFAAATMSGNVLSIGAEAVGSVTAATRLTGATFIDAAAKLGDAGAQLTVVAMHSATEAARCDRRMGPVR
jgi:hypothetical protein